MRRTLGDRAITAGRRLLFLMSIICLTLALAGCAPGSGGGGSPGMLAGGSSFGGAMGPFGGSMMGGLPGSMGSS